MLQQRFGGGEPTRQAKAKRRTPRPFTDPLDDAALLAVDQDSQSEMPESFRQENGRSEGEPEARKGSGEGARKENPEQSGDESKEGDEDADSDSRTPDEDGDDSTPPPEGNNNSDQRRQAPPNPEAASLLAKLQEAMQNMLSKLGLQPETGGFEEKFAAKQRGNKNGKGEQGSGKQQQSGKKGQQSDQAGEPQDGEGQPGDQSKQGEQADAKATGKGDSQQQGTKQPGSGIGSQDGAKDIKQAEQLAAMGKLNEIIGKRSANVTGEATIEVQSTSQQLNTPYSRRNAAHGEGGAEISRDEIPATVETYVQQYFEQVRKSAPPSK
jgi:hypothetical protein